MTLVESVPNVSEGRDLGGHRGDRAGVRPSKAQVLDIHSDPDHHRSVYTFVADEGDLVETLFAGIATGGRADRPARARRDSPAGRRGGRRADRALGRDGMERAREVALELGGRVGSELGLPVFLYGESGDGRRPAFFRRGGPAELQRRIDSGELRPSFGPSALDPAGGRGPDRCPPAAGCFQHRAAGGDLEDAQAIAAAVRESSGGMPGVQALGLLLPASGRVQVSINVIDVEEAPLAVVVERVREVALDADVEVGSGELVGLLPESAVASPRGAGTRRAPGRSRARASDRRAGS